MLTWFHDQLICYGTQSPDTTWDHLNWAPCNQLQKRPLKIQKKDLMNFGQTGNDIISSITNLALETEGSVNSAWNTWNFVQ